MHDTISTILELQEGKLSRICLEVLVAAQQIGESLSKPVEAVVVGESLQVVAEELVPIKLQRVVLIEHPLLKEYTPEAYCQALIQFIESTKPFLVLMPHTYQVRDFAPKLAAQLGRSLLSDAIAYRVEKGESLFTRPLFQGKLAADISFVGDPPHFVSLQAGSFRADQVVAGDTKTPIERLPIQIEAEKVRTKPLERFQEAKRTVDLTQAEIIVAVGRGIKEGENLSLVQKLADALGAEVGGSRPVCDNGWLSMDRQIGSSGQSVAPKLYIALGISGAIQHLVGMKGSRIVVAINKDPDAPIFEVADFGIVSDLFQVVPALIEEIQKVKEK